VTKQSEHLSNAQIENYGIRTSGAGPEAAQRDEHQRVNHQSIDDQSINDQRINDQRVEAHLADCASCRNGLLEFHRNLFAPMADSPEADPSGNDDSPSGDSPSDQRWADSKVEGAKPTDSALADSKFANSKYPVQAQVRTAPTPECPSDDDLRQLAAGLTPDDAATKLIQHAATCDHCGPLLRTFTEDFSDDFTPEEQAALANLKSSSAKWQKNIAREMLHVGATLPPRNSRLQFMKQGTLKWALASAFLLALVTGVAWVFPLLMLHKASQSVEAEYRKGRPMEYRVSGVPYSRFERERSSRGLTPFIEVPNPKRAPLLAANAALLREDFSIAKSILQDALQYGKGSLPILNNLVVAYAMEADHTQSPADYQKALDMTDKILRQNSSDPAALFNRALILERLGRRDESIATLKMLVRVEQDSEWRQEAAEKLQLLR
jgi:tetratricopeptide (TPR) repeat protein